MIELKQTETFRKWRTKLRDQRVRALIASRLALTGSRLETPAMCDRWAKASASCGLTAALVIEFISGNAEIRSPFCCAVETNAHRIGTLKPRNVSRRNGANQMSKKLKNYDPAEDLTSKEAVAVFLAEALQTNDAAYIAHALGVAARAKGMSKIADQTGLSREQLYRSFSADGNPTLKSTLAVVRALGIKLTARAPKAA
jgi:probable addiction module antidote protein